MSSLLRHRFTRSPPPRVTLYAPPLRPDVYYTKGKTRERKGGAVAALPQPFPICPFPGPPAPPLLPGRPGGGRWDIFLDGARLRRYAPIGGGGAHKVQGGPLFYNGGRPLALLTG